MAIYRNRFWRFEHPHAATILLMTANILVFGLCLRFSVATAISPEVLFLNGAMYPRAIERHEYWRLIAHGFLHANLLHLATNMLCLVLWGGLLEKRVGSFYFLLIYFSAMIAGAAASNLHHSYSYLAVGASGAISGILGALLCLSLLGKIDLSITYFAINIGLNIAYVAVAPSKIDWVAHFGGFTAGLIVCALVDVFERANKTILRCKFPEFIKVNGFLLAAVVGICLWRNMQNPPNTGSADNWLLLLTCVALCLAGLKFIDLLLSLKKGLAIVVVVLALANAGLISLVKRMLIAASGERCALQFSGMAGLLGDLANMACSNQPLSLMLAAACAFTITMLLYSRELVRGINDIGFLSASLRAERNRRQGL